jgi:hypothetical protein
VRADEKNRKMSKITCSAMGGEAATVEEGVGRRCGGEG